VTTLTTADIARELGISPRLVRRLARQHQLGTLVTPRLRLFSAEDLERIRNRNRRPGPRQKPPN
jgi:excisionase family DNA binding protein